MVKELLLVCLVEDGLWQRLERFAVPRGQMLKTLLVEACGVSTT
jgi:hypothetical protein